MRTLAIVLAILILGGISILGYAGDVLPANANRVVQDVISAKAYLLVGPHGATTAKLGTNAQGDTALALFADDGKTRAEICVGPKGLPQVALFDEHEVPVVVLRVTRNGDSQIDVCSANGNFVSLIAGPTAGGTLNLGSAGKPRAILGVDRNNLVTFLLLEQFGKGIGKGKDLIERILSFEQQKPGPQRRRSPFMPATQSTSD